MLTVYPVESWAPPPRVKANISKMMHSTDTVTPDVNGKRCGDGAELSHVEYTRVNSSVFSLALKVPTVSPTSSSGVYSQLVPYDSAATEKARDESEVCAYGCCRR